MFHSGLLLSSSMLAMNNKKHVFCSPIWKNTSAMNHCAPWQKLWGPAIRWKVCFHCSCSQDRPLCGSRVYGCLGLLGTFLKRLRLQRWWKWTGCSDCLHTARLLATSRLYQQFLTFANKRTFLSSCTARLCTVLISDYQVFQTGLQIYRSCEMFSGNTLLE